MQWAGVVEEVLDLLQIEHCSVMAHSAGSPYALSFANKCRKRIRGNIYLLAPWVGGNDNGNFLTILFGCNSYPFSGGYKWLKYVPNSILKTAQAAEWKLQEWMIGKPPTIAYEGIGYNADSPQLRPPSRAKSPRLDQSSVYPSMATGRPSLASSSFSEYDDLRDFDGRFESRSTLGTSRPSVQSASEAKIYVAKRKNSRGFLERLKGSPSPQSPQEKEEKQGPRRLKSLRSMGSLKSKSRKSEPEQQSPKLPLPLSFDPVLGLETFQWGRRDYDPDPASKDIKYYTTGPATLPRANGRRSISFTSTSRSSTVSSTVSPVLRSQSPSPSTPTNDSSAYQAALGAALIAASHSESAKGTHNDLLQILNHDNHPWGFSYSSYPHNVKVWYGEKDEKIAENAVRWMEKNMGDGQCSVKVVKGADHGLMYNSSVVVEVLEEILTYWK
jgi:hypothetical protein